MSIYEIYSPLHVLPIEIWNSVIQELTASSFEVFRNAFPELHDSANLSRKLFSSVFKILYGQSYVQPDAARSCRQVCSDWKNGVDAFFQKSNFHSLEMKNVQENCSDLVLRLPMELADMYKIYEMNSHPGCVSFGKKLTLLMRRDQRNAIINQPEVNLLFQSVSTFWRQFEHLDVSDFDANPDFDNVPEDFEMYIPFLQKMSNLKKVTLRLNRRWVNARILLHMPESAKLEEIYMEHRGEFIRGLLPYSGTVLHRRYAKSATFLAGVSSASIKLYADWISTNNETGPTFENLKEIHIFLDHKWTQHLVDDLSVSTIKLMFPVVTILEISVERRFTIQNLWKSLGTFANMFPCLQHFSLSGECIFELCESFKTISETEYYARANRSISVSVLKTFQYQCPLHTPTELLQHFPSLKHVMVEEWPGRCQRHNSKSNDYGFVHGFFNKFSSVETLSFVTFKTREGSGNVSGGPMTVKHFKSDMAREKKLTYMD